MARKATNLNSGDRESRQGQIQIGTARQGLQIPEAMRDAFADLTRAKGPGSIRFMGTVAMALLLELPDDVRMELFEHVQQERWSNFREVTSAEVWERFEALMKAHWGIDDGAVPSERG